MVGGGVVGRSYVKINQDMGVPGGFGGGAGSGLLGRVAKGNDAMRRR